MLDRLPNELFWLITNQIAVGDLKRLCEVSKYLCQATIPRLYESVTLFVTEPKLKNTPCLPVAHFKHIKHISFKDALHSDEILEDCCLFHGVPNAKDSLRFALHKERAAAMSYSDWGSPFDFASSLESIILNLTNNLRTFKWNIGTCIPNGVLDHNSHFETIQKTLKKISFATDAGCKANSLMPSVALGKCEAIRSLSWKGLSKTVDFDSVRDCITVNAQGIEVLVLDLLNWGKAKRAYYEGLKRCEQNDHALHSISVDNFFARNVLRVSPEPRAILPHLSSLSLSEVSFEAAVEEMQHALNIPQLCSLKLRNCRHSLALLDTIVRGAKTMRLRAFELVIDTKTNAFQGAHGQPHGVLISKFLNSFQGLEDLFLRITEHIDWAMTARSILNHIFTLNRLITHGASITPWCIELCYLHQKANVTCVGTSNLRSNVVHVKSLCSCRERTTVRPANELLGAQWSDY